MDDELRSWSPTDEELADLQCLFRRYCKITGTDMGEFANAAAKAAAESPYAAALSGGAKAKIARDFKKFVSRWNTKLANRMRPYAGFLVDVIVTNARAHPHNQVYAKYAELGRLLVRHRNFRELAAVSDFMVVRNEKRTGELAKEEQKTKAENNLFVAFNRLSRDFNDYSHDVHLRHARVKAAPAPRKNGGNGVDVSPLDGQFVLIRRSSRTPENFVAHSMVIGRHVDDKRVLYFSEQLRTLEHGVETNRRKTEGVCLFDGAHMTAIARPKINTYFTYVSARIDDVDAPLDSFRALVMTANRNGERISAEALCLRCDNRDDRKRKVGLHGEADLLKMFSGPQQDTLRAWLAGPPPATIVL